MWYGGRAWVARWAGPQRAQLPLPQWSSSGDAEGDASELRGDPALAHLCLRRPPRMGRGARLPGSGGHQPTGLAHPKAKYRLRRLAHARRSPQGPARMMCARDCHPHFRQISEALYADSGFRKVREWLRTALLVRQRTTCRSSRYCRTTRTALGGSEDYREEPLHETAHAFKWSKQRSPGPATRMIAFSAWEAREGGSGLINSRWCQFTSVHCASVLLTLNGSSGVIEVAPGVRSLPRALRDALKTSNAPGSGPRPSRRRPNSDRHNTKPLGKLPGRTCRVLVRKCAMSVVRKNVREARRRGKPHHQSRSQEVRAFVEASARLDEVIITRVDPRQLRMKRTA